MTISSEGEVINKTNAKRFASDFVHLLMCNDTYQIYHEQKKQSNESIDFNGEDWNVYKIYMDDTKIFKMCTFKAVLYKSDTKKQFVLAFKGLDAEFEDIFNDKGSLSNNLNGILLNGVIPQLYSCFSVADEVNKLSVENDYNLSFTGFSNGAQLGEYAIYYTFRYLNGKKHKLKAILFNSDN